MKSEYVHKKVVELADCKGYDVLKIHSPSKFSHLHYVIAYRDLEFVVWTYNNSTEDFNFGKYGLTLEQANNEITKRSGLNAKKEVK